MEHSLPIEQHATQKLDKILDVLRDDVQPPFYSEMWIKANRQHPHHSVELHLKTSRFSLNSRDEGTDMYIVIDSTIDKMIILIKKEKEKQKDLLKHPNNEKAKFGR
jgi:ribosomal subunit interface protein